MTGSDAALLYRGGGVGRRLDRLSAHRVRYLLIAAGCAVSQNILMIVGDRAGSGYVVMTFVSFMTVTPAAYALHARYSFTERGTSRGLLTYMAGIAISIPLSLIVMSLLHDGAKLPIAVAAPVTTLVLFVWNYLSAKLAVRRRSSRAG